MHHNGLGLRHISSLSPSCSTWDGVTLSAVPTYGSHDSLVPRKWRACIMQLGSCNIAVIMGFATAVISADTVRHPLQDHVGTPMQDSINQGAEGRFGALTFERLG